MIYLEDKTIVDFYDYSHGKTPVTLRIILTTCIAHLLRCRQVILWHPSPQIHIFLHNSKVMGFYDLDMANDACVIVINLKESAHEV
jgi:hypothetical protein